MYTCDICLKDFENENKLEKHKNMKRKCGYICEYCKGFYEKHEEYINHKCYIKNNEMLKMLSDDKLKTLSKYNTDIYHMLYGNTNFKLKPNIVKIRDNNDNVKLIGGNYYIDSAKNVICENVNSLKIYGQIDKLSGTVNEVTGYVKLFENANVNSHIYNIIGQEKNSIIKKKFTMFDN